MSSHQLDEERIFHTARLLPSSDAMSDYLDQVCAGDQALRERVEELLRVHEQEQSFLKSSGEPLPTEAMGELNITAGQQIGRYKLLQKIGEGGFGVVFMAEQSRPVRRKVALKVIKPGMDSQAVVARFEAERQALAMMDHPNIARVFDGGATDGGRPYFVMELVKGVPITEYCDKNELSTEQRLNLFTTVCQAVQHAHQKGIIHRDLKPSNVLVTLADGEPVVKVIDFGVAKATNQQLTEKTLFTAFGQMVGTPQYMSPEQAEMSCLDVDTRSDVYSLGVLLYELLTGTTPLEAERLRTAGYAEMQRLIREEEPPKPSTRLSTSGDKLTILAKHRKVTPEKLKNQVKGDLDWVVMKALEKDRNRRYATPVELSDDVTRYLTKSPVEAYPPSTAYRLRKFIGRNRSLVLGASVITVVLLMATTVASWGWMRAMQQWQIAEKQREVAEDRLGVVKDYTMLLAKSGNQRDLELAIKTSEIVGAEKVWQAMLRAQSLLERGKTREAVTLLQREGDLESLACKGLYATALIYNGQTDEHLPLFRELQASRPTTPEEMVFVGQGLQLDANAWWELADRAVNKRDSLFAKLNRAQAAINYSLDSGDVSIARNGIQDLAEVQQSVVETPYLIANRLCLHLSAMILSQDDPRVLETLRVQAEEDVNLLETTYSDYQWGLLVTAWYKDQFMRDDADEAWRAVLDHGAGGWHDIHAAAMVLRQGSLEKWRDKLEGQDTLERAALASLLAGSEVKADRDKAMDIYNDIKLHRRIIHYRSGVGIEIPLIAKERDEARRDAEMLLDSNADFLEPFDHVMTQFIAGQMSLTDFERHLESMDGVDRLMGYFTAGLCALAEDDLELAKSLFQRSRETGVYHTSDYYWARAFLTLFDRRQGGTEELTPPFDFPQ